MRILPGFRPASLSRTNHESDEQRLVRYVKDKRHMDALYLLLSQQKAAPLSVGGNGRGGGPEGSSSPTPPSSSLSNAELLVRRADRCVDAESFLHYVLQHQPTADLVDFVLNLGGARSDSGSAGGGTPLLHAAVANGCSRGVVETILHDPSGAGQARDPDATGRCPLHWACVNPRRAKAQACRSVVEVLLGAYPEAQDIPDKNGKTPLDLAKIHKASSSIIKLLNGGIDDESSTSSLSFLRRGSFSSKRQSHRGSALRRSLTPHTIPDDGASDEGTDNDNDSQNKGPSDYRQLYQVMATKVKDDEVDDGDDDISSLGSEE